MTDSMVHQRSARQQNVLILSGVVLSVAVGVGMGVAGYSFAVGSTAGITTLCAFFWMTEAIPIPATSLIPFFAFPMFGVIPAREIAQSYGHNLILLLMGGFLLSRAMEKSGAHRRLAIGMVKRVGGERAMSLVLGFMLASSVLSMWISNTATALMLLPVAIAVLEQTEQRKQLMIPLLLAVAYGANIGGMGTPVGSPTNMVFMGVYGETIRDKPELGLSGYSFARWMTIAVPLVVILLPLIWFRLAYRLRGTKLDIHLPEMGKWRKAESRVMAVFAITAMLWIFRTSPFGGWTGLLNHVIETPGTTMGKMVSDSSVALMMVVVMFLVPNGEKGRLLDWETAVGIPWGILLLFGGGLAIADGFGESGLSEILGTALAGLDAIPMYFMIVIICLAVSFLTEVTSNTATTTVLMPILVTMGIKMEVDPALIMIPATLSASCAFMLPVATPPNAVVFSTGEIPIREMMREGFIINICAGIVIGSYCYFML